MEELVSGAAAVAMQTARKDLSQCGDIEQLLSRIHSMGGASATDDTAGRYHPNERAVLYEGATHTKRKVEKCCAARCYDSVASIDPSGNSTSTQAPSARTSI